MHQEADYLWKTRFRSRCDGEEIDNSGMGAIRTRSQDSDIAFMKNSPTHIFIDSCILWIFFIRDTLWLAIEIMLSILRREKMSKTVSVPKPPQQIIHNSPHCPCLRFREAGQGICLEQHVQRLKDRNHDAIGSRVRQRILDEVFC